jgi:hypothetical protein
VYKDKYTIHRKRYDDMCWGEPIATLESAASFWIDKHVKTGTLYEYMIVGEDDAPTFKRGQDNENNDLHRIRRGYIAAGIKVDNTKPRGKVILVVEESIHKPLEKEMSLFKEDLRGDGWEIKTVFASKNDTYTSVKDKIKKVYYESPEEFKNLILLGRIPVVLSGTKQSPDNHTYGHPFAADCFYADMDGKWTDEKTDNPFTIKNRPGDGHFDQDVIPSPVEMGFGRIDVSNLSKVFPDKTETELFKIYFDKEHRYRHVDLTFVIPRKSILRSGHLIPTAQSYSSFVALSGVEHVKIIKNTKKIVPGKEFEKYDKVDKDVVISLKNAPSLFYLKGGGVPSATVIANEGFGAVGLTGWQSHWGKWDRPDNPMRTLLAAKGYGLMSYWNIPTSFPLHIMGAGKTAGDFIKRSINNSSRDGFSFLYPHDFAKKSSYSWTPEKIKELKVTDDKSFAEIRNKHAKQKENTGVTLKELDGHIMIALIGNPTLRFFPVAPPSNLTISKGKLSWTRSTDTNIVAYRIYKASNESGSYKPVGEVKDETTFHDNENEEFYMVKAIKLDKTASGTFYNSSQGVFAKRL